MNHAFKLRMKRPELINHHIFHKQVQAVDVLIKTGAI